LPASSAARIVSPGFHFCSGNANLQNPRWFYAKDGTAAPDDDKVSDGRYSRRLKRKSHADHFAPHPTDPKWLFPDQGHIDGHEEARSEQQM